MTTGEPTPGVEENEVEGGPFGFLAEFYVRQTDGLKSIDSTAVYVGSGDGIV